MTTTANTTPPQDSAPRLRKSETDFELFDGTRLHAYAIEGDVLEQDRRERQSVSQAGPMVLASVHGESAINVIPSAVHTETIHAQSVWLRRDDGSEKSYDLNSVAPFSARVGHRVRLVYVTDTKGAPGILSGAMNRNTGEGKFCSLESSFQELVPKPMANYRASKLLWGLIVAGALAAVGSGFAYQSAQQSLQRAESHLASVRCDVPGMSPADRKACQDRAAQAETRQATADAHRAVGSAEDTKALMPKVGGAAAVLSLLVLLLGLPIRRGMFRSRLLSEFRRVTREVSGQVASA